MKTIEQKFTFHKVCEVWAVFNHPKVKPIAIFDKKKDAEEYANFKNKQYEQKHTTL